MIIYRSFYSETSKTTLAILAVLAAVLLLFGLTALLGRVTRGDIPETVVFLLLGWQTVKRLDLLLPLAFYLGVLLTLSRWYRDNEMTVLAASGVGILQLLRPVAGLTVVVALITAAVAFVSTPFADRTIDQIKAKATARYELAGIAPGAFNEVRGSNGVLFAAGIIGDRLDRVFFSDRYIEHERIIVADSATPSIDPSTGERLVVMNNGWAYEGNAGLGGWRTLNFERYILRFEERSPEIPPTTIDGLSTMELLARNDRVSVVAWHWRLAKPMLVLVLVPFAVFLAYTDARRGRLANLFGAVLIYFIYSNLLTMAQALLKKGQVPPAVGLWWVHGGLSLIAVYLLWRRIHNKPMLPVFGMMSKWQ